MKDKDYREASRLAKEKEGRLITGKIFTSAAEAPSISEGRVLFSRLGYDLTGVDTMEQLIHCLIKVVEDDYDSFYQLIPQPDVLDILAVRYYFSSLSAAFEEHIGKASHGYYPEIGMIPSGEYASFFRRQDPFESLLPDYLIKPAQKAVMDYQQGRENYLIQADFSRAMYGEMFHLANRLDNKFITDMVSIMVDFYNVSQLAEIKAEQKSGDWLTPLLVEGGSTSPGFFITGITRTIMASVPARYHKGYSEKINAASTLFEKKGSIEGFDLLKLYIMADTAGRTSLIDYGAEIPFGYLLKKEYEVVRIYRTLEGLDRGLPSGEIKELTFA